MRPDPLERLSIRAALILGFGLVLGLWVFTGWTFTRHLADTERQSLEVTARYMRAQDLLSAIRAQLNVSSIILRDALLDLQPDARPRYIRRLDDNYATIDTALDSYVPVESTPATVDQVARLRREIADVREATLQVLRQERVGVPGLDVLNGSIAPRRAAAIAMSDDIRVLNRKAFVQHQTATAAIHRSTEAQWWWQLGGALIANLGIGLIAIFYAGRLEDRLRRQREKDRENARELQLLSARLVAAQEEERRTIARELHDEVGQVLSAIKVDLSVAQRALEQQGIAATALDEIQGLTDGALNTVRDLSQLLRPAVLDDLGLAAAVDGLLRAFARRHRVRVELVQEGSTDRLPIETEVAAFRIIQEALTNVARHAGASRCTVRLRGASGTLDVEIEDDGAGFDPAAAPTSRSGLGLVGIRERATELGGTVRVDAAPGRGTRIAVHLP
ncbi:MAG: sensor histidine kinase, partial [Acidobacteriota bacterium]|nr:sensor histidine kinase [Acidobacteriota bacterium]